MRKEKSIKNAITALISNLIALLLGFLMQKIFIQTLGDEYLGLNSLLTNVVSMLSIVELGIGSAIVYALYEPLANQNKEKTKSLMQFYKKTYNIIAIIVFILGILLLPFLSFFITTALDINIYLIFMLFILEVVFSYLLSYKRSILQADQNSYIINIVHILYSIFLNIGLGIVLIYTKNYILYLIIRCVFRMLENIVLSIVANKLYPYIKEKAAKLEVELYQDIKTKVKGLFFHKIGSYIVLGTDNIIISKFLGNIMVAFYSNYYMIINALSMLLSQIFTAVTASVGNLLVEDNKEKSCQLYKKLMFLNFWLYSFSMICIFLCMEPFISVWVGSERLLSFSVLIVLCINFYMMGMRSSIGVFKEAAGIYYEDRLIPIIESVLNIVLSLILVKYFGLLGVFLGTLGSSFVVSFYSLPHYVYERVFCKPKKEYYQLYLKYLLINVMTAILSYSIYLLITHSISNNFICLLIGIIIGGVVPNMCYFLLFKSSKELLYFKEILFSFVYKMKTKKKNIS